MPAEQAGGPLGVAIFRGLEHGPVFGGLALPTRG
jgi:hypothetical protein